MILYCNIDLHVNMLRMYQHHRNKVHTDDKKVLRKTTIFTATLPEAYTLPPLQRNPLLVWVHQSSVCPASLLQKHRANHMYLITECPQADHSIRDRKSKLYLSFFFFPNATAPPRLASAIKATADATSAVLDAVVSIAIAIGE